MIPTWKRAFERQSLNLEEVCIIVTLPLEMASMFPRVRGGNDTSAPHSTVLYVGRVDPENIPRFLDIVKKVCSRFKPFECSLGGLFYFQEGKHGFPAVLRVHSKVLSQLQSQLKSALQKAGLPLEDKWDSFRPHSTLQYVAEKNGYTGNIPRGSWTIDAVDIYGLDLSIPLGMENCLERPLPTWKSNFEGLVACHGAPSPRRSDLQDPG